MKMLFATPDHHKVELAKRELFEAGIRCEVRQNTVAQSVLGISSPPELWVKHDGDVLKALRLLGTRHLSQMTAIPSEH